jgi:SAM-dependent methyltransferase
MTAAWSSAEGRRVLSRSLRGSGIEVGPGESPFPLDYPGASAVSLDRWGADEIRGLFKEIDAERFAEPDVRVDLNVDRLSAFADGSQDFIVASHVLEHLVEPIGQLEDMHRVLAPGGTLLLLLPDRRRTFDRTREPTTLQHLITEYDAKVTVLDDAHLEEFVAHVPEDWGADDPPKDQAERFERHRQRSIHVHVWTEDEFAEVIAHCIERLGMQWELLDRLGTDEVEGSIEFGLTLRKSTVALDPATGAAHFRMAWAELGARSARWAEDRGIAAQLEGVRAELADVSAELAQAKRVLANHERVLGPLRRTGAGALVRRIRR